MRKFLKLLKALYDTFLKGKVVTVGGTSVVLPSQGPAPAGQSPLDSKPHKPGPVQGIVPPSRKPR